LCGDDSFEGVTSLVEKNLLYQESGLGGEVQYAQAFGGSKSAGPRPAPVTRPGAEPDPPGVIASLRIEDATGAELSDLAKKTKVKLGDSFERSRVLSEADRLRERLLKDGYIEAVIRPEITRDAATGGYHVIYRVTRGPKIKVEVVSVGGKGERAARRALRAYWRETPFSFGYWEEAARSLVETLQDDGYYAADATWETVEGKDDAIVRFHVDRGAHVTLRALRLHGVSQLSESRVKEVITSLQSSRLRKPLLRASRLDEDLASVRALYRDEGFARVKISRPRIALSANADAAEVDVDVEEGPRFTVEDVAFEGPSPVDDATMLDWIKLKPGTRFSPRGLAEAENELAALVRSGQRVVVAFPHRGEALRTQNMLRKVEARILEPGDKLTEDAGLFFAVAPARRGFVWRDLGLVLLPDTQIFRKRAPRHDARLGRALQSFADLRTGDYVVHEDHGVGKLLGFETKEVAGVTRDYLFLGFRGDDRLYVPHEQLGKVSRYIGADNTMPALSKLGGKAWDNLKTRARESVRELAGELLALYAQRQQAPGVAYDLRHEYLERLEAEFPYRETPDQQAAIEAVKEDLEAPRPMDRLVCGDVGFGKTEVAIRAAFAVAVNGKQALMLAPTTILAEQHWHTFRDRYRDFPVRVEMVSRFRAPKEVKQVLADFQEGKVDVLIGTHRILSRDVIPKELGLVILDEEQRFGVAQKELLRSLRLEVDVLTLSATPIPRTLHMSLSGLRDISIIETPPEGRRPIRTTVSEFDEEIVKQALEREIERGGQAFYLHNRVDTIDEATEKLRQLVPSLRFLEAHGQMRERELEEKMHAFLRGDADVLVSTTIIESGLDIPQANTLIVERADQLGLSQLYQIRGRVGRSDVTAHAYLFYPDMSELSPEARARLATLADHTELGAGFAIAMRDLEIRGAGNLLGDEQSGHVAALGFELYVELLAEAVAELSGERRIAARPVRVDARVDAYVPPEYIASEALKIDLHRRLALSESEDEVRELQAATVDRYGPLPEPVENLFLIQEAKLKLARAGADYFVFRGGKATIGRMVLGSDELRDLRRRVDTAVYTTSNHEVSVREDGFPQALRLVDAILAARQAA
jgi:transcription-repair coupling factor